MQMGPDVMLALKVACAPGCTLDAAVETLNALERRIKAKFPEVRGASSSPTSPTKWGHS